MNVSWLTTLRQVIDEGSYSRAAETLFVSQSAISQQIRQLEKFVGTKLVRRVGHELQLTVAGQEIYDLACRVESDLSSTMQHISELTGDSQQTITIASSPTPLVYYLPPVLGRFWRESPEVSVKTVVRSGVDIPRAVKTGAADVGILMEPYLDPTLKAVPLRDERIIGVAHPDHPLADRIGLVAQDFSSVRVATPLTGSQSRKLLDHWFAERGERLIHTTELYSLAEIRNAVVENLAVGFLDRYAVVDDLRESRLVELNIEGFNLSRTVYVTYRSDIQGPAKRLVDILLEESLIPAEA